MLMIAFQVGKMSANGEELHRALSIRWLHNKKAGEIQYR